MPRSFQEKYPNEMRNLRLNSRKLTTPFDIHETLKHFLNFDSETSESSSSKRGNAESPPPRGISLFKYISPNRSCEDALIEAHWCSCLNWIDLNITTTTITESKTSNIGAIKTDTLPILLDPNIDDLDSARSDEFYSGSLNVSSSNATSLNYFPKRQMVNLKEYRGIFSNLKIYSSTVVRIANKAVDFINSLIDPEVRLYCERIRLHSIQRLSKLDLNRKLLAFKMSKDIHGREALFDESLESSNEHLSSLDEFFKPVVVVDLTKPTTSTSTSTSVSVAESQNATVKIETSSYNNKPQLNETIGASKAKSFHSHMLSVYQISLTTWPGNATYELSFKYNRVSGEFKFNKNEISRINSYNSTSSCMLNKRPDLRQYCYCKYV
jgi:hypothetical protein